MKRRGRYQVAKSNLQKSNNKGSCKKVSFVPKRERGFPPEGVPAPFDGTVDFGEIKGLFHFQQAQQENEVRGDNGSDNQGHSGLMYYMYMDHLVWERQLQSTQYSSIYVIKGLYPSIVKLEDYLSSAMDMITMMSCGLTIPSVFRQEVI